MWDPHEPFGGLDAEQSQARELLLWKGHCSVHARFTVQQIDVLRKQHPGVQGHRASRVPLDVVQAADDSGSTEYILKTVREQPAGSSGRSGPRCTS